MRLRNFIEEVVRMNATIFIFTGTIVNSIGQWNSYGKSIQIQAGTRRELFKLEPSKAAEEVESYVNNDSEMNIDLSSLDSSELFRLISEKKITEQQFNKYLNKKD